MESSKFNARGHTLPPMAVRSKKTTNPDTTETIGLTSSKAVKRALKAQSAIENLEKLTLESIDAQMRRGQQIDDLARMICRVSAIAHANTLPSLDEETLATLIPPPIKNSETHGTDETYEHSRKQLIQLRDLIKTLSLENSRLASLLAKTTKGVSVAVERAQENFKNKSGEKLDLKLIRGWVEEIDSDDEDCE